MYNICEDYNNIKFILDVDISPVKPETPSNCKLRLFPVS
jgi:hypothetical protein